MHFADIIASKLLVTVKTFIRFLQPKNELFGQLLFKINIIAAIHIKRIN